LSIANIQVATDGCHPAFIEAIADILGKPLNSPAKKA
jgi:hypothetical protein